MEMNKYLIAALYVMAGCVAAFPVGTRGSVMPAGADGYRLLMTPTEKVVTVACEQKSVEKIVPGRSDKAPRRRPRTERITDISREVVQPGWKVPEITANPIRAPGALPYPAFIWNKRI